ncbi:interleukin-12 subunit beta [Lampris incognitus]|uniref:interleukin-12 subunit beta n=1 Tax=Lampris incognitus TaxID=2546036 RepID=UPI0024B4ED8D|nr:interleukin-12 subunit beta [Lampris incognitus]
MMVFSKRHLSQWILGFLLSSLPGLYGNTSFPDNVVVIKENVGTALLTCDTDIGDNVTWRFERDGLIEDVELGGEFEQVGRDLWVSEVLSPITGQYSCWFKGKRLSSAYLLLDAEEEYSDSLISCRAKSYSCTFTCIWNQSEYTAVRLGLGRNCSEGEKTCSWVAPLPDGEFQFELAHSLSPYEEESQMIHVTAEAIIEHTFFRMTKKFYLRDIILPDSPQKVTCQELGENLNVSVQPASSWSTPHSYFSLDHEIEYVYKDDGKSERSASPLIPKRISRLRVRSRDPLVLSAWSQWTPWKYVTY